MATIDEVISRLEKEYGSRHWQFRGDPVTVLVTTVLSQNTSDVNSERAFQRLKQALPSWEEVARTDIEDIASAIHPGGLARIKAPRIKAILEHILKERGSLDLSFLRELPLAEAKTWLRRLPGVGSKTAACVLLFSLGRQVLPVDTHIHRVAMRLGLLGEGASREKAHQVLAGLVPPETVYDFHLNVIAHGRRVCQARGPRCEICVLAHLCCYVQAMREDVASQQVYGEEQ